MQQRQSFCGAGMLTHTTKAIILWCRYADPYNKGKQRVQLVNSLIGQQDGMEDFVLVGEDMESHIFDPERAEEEGGVNQAQQLIVKVPSMTVRTFAKKYNVPKHFAVLSIDAEGIGDKVCESDEF